MERKDFLKRACAFGCGCFGLHLIVAAKSYPMKPQNPLDNEPDWRIEFMQQRFKSLIDILDASLDDDTLIPILEKLGGSCGDGLANQFKNNPEEFFNYIKANWAESVHYDKEQRTVKVREKKRDTCNCPFIPAKDAPEMLCNCSIGTQKRIYENLFGCIVKVTLDSSILRGDDRCSFTIQLL